ncbi:hypothetical protein ACJRO7_027442 [Eucalyptus globulus]|uniref:Uncharacterized protein n=1 Tax=Eucalyptus globulus TaxID=34317 RepID=A0ABD3JW62_EUCGL
MASYLANSCTDITRGGVEIIGRKKSWKSSQPSTVTSLLLEVPIQAGTCSSNAISLAPLALDVPGTSSSNLLAPPLQCQEVDKGARTGNWHKAGLSMNACLGLKASSIASILS